jgi:guanine nucleotide-binding protein G(o) subunit alpha
MGCGTSSQSGDDGLDRQGETTLADAVGTNITKREVDISLTIDQRLELAKERNESRVKLLFLGPGESGKSTIFKQLRFIHGSEPLAKDDLRMYGVAVRSNCVTAMRKLCVLLRDLDLEDQLAIEGGVSSTNDGSGKGPLSPKEAYDVLMARLVDEPSDLAPNADGATPMNNAHRSTTSDDCVAYSARAGRVPNEEASLFLQLWKYMSVLWETDTMRIVWQKRSMANVIDGHSTYLDDLARIASPVYRPTDQDILHTRIKTSQPVVERFQIGATNFEVCDVGGQRSERRKWIDCFDNVNAVIFVAALSEYDQNLAEARRINRMVESLDMFKSVCSHVAFANSAIILFLNKKDVFAEKILYSDIRLRKPFQDYAGPPRGFNEGVLYFVKKFKDCLVDHPFQDSYIHVTNATDTDNMRFVLDATREIIMTDNLKLSGFLGTSI